MKKLIILCLLSLLLPLQTFAATYMKVMPEFLEPSQSSSYEAVNQTLAVIFSKIKPEIKTDRYLKYYHDFTLIKDDGTQNKAYHYVKNGNAELMYSIDTNELKYVSFRRPELQKCRILKSSKIKELDNNAGNAIRAAAPFKPFPKNFFNEELVIILNFNFSL